LANYKIKGAQWRRRGGWNDRLVGWLAEFVVEIRGQMCDLFSGEGEGHTVTILTIIYNKFGQIWMEYTL